MKVLDTEQDALKKITDYLLEETLQPARTEAEKIIEDAKAKAADIIEKAEEEQRRLVEDSKEKIEKEQRSFKSTLSMGLEQTVESLKQMIVKDLFSPTLQQMVDKEMQKPNVVAKLIDTLVKALEKEGTAADLQAFIPQGVDVKEVNGLLTKETLDKLKGHSVTLGKINSGVEVKLVNKQVTLEMTGKAIHEMLLNYVRKELRDLIFKGEG